MAGYSPGGLVSTAAAGLDAALNASFPGSTLTYQTSSGGLANAMLLAQDRVPLGLISDTELNVVVKGRPPINKKIEGLRLLINPYSPSSRFQASHVIANKAWAEKHGIQTVADIAEKKPPMRVVFNRPGNLDGDVGLGILAEHGITQDNIKKWGGQVVRAASQEMTSLMLDRRLDVVVLGISVGHPRIQEMENGLDIVMLPFDDKIAKAVTDDLGGAPCTVTTKDYKFLAKDTASVCVGLSMLAHEKMDEQTVYNVTKAIVDNIDRYRSAHRLLKQAVTVESLTEPTQVPYHAGTERYLREKGLLKK